MSIRQRGQRFQARLMIDGREFTRSFPSRQDAEDWIVVTQAQRITGNLPSPTKTTVREYALRWLGTYDTAPANTRRFHEVNVHQHLIPRLGSAPIAVVTPTDISRLINGISADRTPALADRVYRSTSALFRSAEADGLIDRSPCHAKRHRPRRQREPQAVLERPDARRVLLNLGGWQRDTAFLQLALGARFGEIAGLTPHDVNLKGGTITIARRVSRGTVRATKNHRRRTLEVPSKTRSMLDRLVRTAGNPPLLPPLGDREHDASEFHRRWLIQTSTGRSACITAFNRALKDACAAAGAPPISSHGLRHTYVSWMIDEGHSADKIAFWIGDTPATVRAVYAHMLEASSAPAALAIDAALDDLG